MAHDPADRVHRTEMPRGVLFGHATQAAKPFASCESQLVDERMGHASLPLACHLLSIRKFSAWCRVCERETQPFRSVWRLESAGMRIPPDWTSRGHHSLDRLINLRVAR